METTDDLMIVMRERVESLMEKGQWDKAISAAESTLETFSKKYENDPANNVGDYASALEIRANLHRDRGDINIAEEQYVKIVELLRETSGYPELCGRVGANLAMIYEARELPIDAMKFYIWSLENLEIIDPPNMLEIAGVNNNLAYLYESEGYLNEAEELFLRSLAIYKAELGSTDASVADIYNNLGGLYYRQDNNGQALQMHEMALEIREEVLGSDHIDTAQSYGNIALIHSDMEKTTLARGAYDSALKILEHSEDSDSMKHYAIISANYSHMLESIGLDRDAHKLEKRTNKFMKSFV